MYSPPRLFSSHSGDSAEQQGFEVGLQVGSQELESRIRGQGSGLCGMVPP